MTNRKLLRKGISLMGNTSVLKVVVIVVLLSVIWFVYDWYRVKSEEFNKFVILRERLVHDHVIEIYISACRANAENVLSQDRPKGQIQALPEYYEYCELEAGHWAGYQALISSRKLSFAQYVMGNELVLPRNIEEIKDVARRNAATMFKTE